MLKQKIGAAFLSTALFLSSVTPALATSNLNLEGNGAGSENEIEMSTETENLIVQNNQAYISNTVTANSDSGSNDANQNTGGNVTIDTGNAVTLVDVANTANLNKAVVNDCGTCASGDVNVNIKDNGAGSENEVELESESSNEIYQDNHAKFKNYVDATAKTGYNDANQNTGGDVAILTGNALTDVAVLNRANKNVALVGSLGGQAGNANLTIAGNGSGSDNEIEMKSERENLITQDNHAWFYNDLDAQAKTGDNDANQNTGGGVFIGTGDAKTFVDLKNAANFNWAALDCGCLLGVNANIKDNGSGSENEIEKELEAGNEVYQGGEGNGNSAGFKNYLDAFARAGYNDANQNTGGDSATLTGNAGSATTVENKANANIFTVGDFELEFDPHAVWSYFGF